jgi:hypothetical protein
VGKAPWVSEAPERSENLRAAGSQELLLTGWRGREGSGGRRWEPTVGFASLGFSIALPGGPGWDKLKGRSSCSRPFNFSEMEACGFHHPFNLVRNQYIAKKIMENREQVLPKKYINSLTT